MPELSGLGRTEYNRYRGLHKVISGGQTGADQGGLLAAHGVGVLTGGTAPKGYMTSKGPNLLLQAFGLLDRGTLQTRTKMNVQDSDATIILASDTTSPGTMLTAKLCVELRKPVLLLDIAEITEQFACNGFWTASVGDPLCQAMFDFIRLHKVCVLNVAGNRERFEDLRTTKIVKGMLLNTFQLLNLEDLLIRDSDL